MYFAVIVVFNLIGLFLWALVKGTALCRNADTIKFLDDEQMFVLAAMRNKRI